MAVPRVVTHRTAMGPSDSILRDIPERRESPGPHNTRAGVHRSVIYNSQLFPLSEFTRVEITPTHLLKSISLGKNSC